MITEIANERLQDLLCCAFEGGSNYWYEIRRYVYPEGQTKQSLGIEYQHLEAPFKGGKIVVGDCENSMPEKELDRIAIDRGLEVMREKYPKHYADFIAENEDADTGDVFLQCCLYGEVVFG